MGSARRAAREKREEKNNAPLLLKSEAATACRTRVPCFLVRSLMMTSLLSTQKERQVSSRNALPACEARGEGDTPGQRSPRFLNFQHSHLVPHVLLEEPERLVEAFEGVWEERLDRVSGSGVVEPEGLVDGGGGVVCVMHGPDGGSVLDVVVGKRNCRSGHRVGW